MAMTCLNNRKNDSFIFSTIEELVPFIKVKIRLPKLLQISSYTLHQLR